MKIDKILKIIAADEEFQLGCSFYGIRADRKYMEVGEAFENSHDWYQDDPEIWGGKGSFNEELEMWDGGELEGVCTIGLGDFPDLETIKKAIERTKRLYLRDNMYLYLVRGITSQAGNDIGEQILGSAVCMALI